MIRLWFVALGIYEAVRQVPENVRLRRAEKADTRVLEGDALLEAIAKKVIR